MTKLEGLDKYNMQNNINWNLFMELENNFMNYGNDFLWNQKDMNSCLFI
jgi:hypothetical protein